MARKLLIAAAAIVFVSLCHEQVFADPVHVTIRQKKPKKPKPPPKPKKPKNGAAAEATTDVSATPTLIPPVMSPTGASAGSDGTVSVATNNVTTAQGSTATNFTSTGVQANVTTTGNTSTAPSDTIVTGANSLVSNPQAVAAAIFGATPFTQASAMGGVATATQPVSNGISYFIGGANPGIVTVPNPNVSTSNVPIDYGQATSPGLIPNNLAPNIPRGPSQQVTITNTPIVGGGTSVSVTNNNGVIGAPSPSFGINQTVNTGAGIITFPTTNSTPTSTQLTASTTSNAITTGTTSGITGVTTTRQQNSVSTINLPQSTVTTNNPTSVNGNVVGVPSGTPVVANTTGVTGTTNNILGVSGSTSSNTVGALPTNVGAPLATGIVTNSGNGTLGGVFTDGIGAQNLQGGIAPNLGTLGESSNVGGFTTGIGSSNLSGGAAGTVGGPSSGSNF